MILGQSLLKPWDRRAAASNCGTSTPNRPQPRPALRPASFSPRKRPGLPPGCGVGGPHDCTQGFAEVPARLPHLLAPAPHPSEGAATRSGGPCPARPASAASHPLSLTIAPGSPAGPSPSCSSGSEDVEITWRGRGGAGGASSDRTGRVAPPGAAAGLKARVFPETLLANGRHLLRLTEALKTAENRERKPFNLFELRGQAPGSRVWNVM